MCETSLCPSKRSKFTWLEHLPVTQEAAASSPVAPATITSSSASSLCAEPSRESHNHTATLGLKMK